MPIITDRLNALMLTSSPEAQRAIANSLTTFTQRLDAAASLDWNSGQAQFDENAVRAAAEELQRMTSYVVGTTFPDDVVSSIRGGFAVLRAEQRDAIPWRSLADPRAVSQLSDVRLQALGVTGGEPEAVRQEITARFPNLPPYIDTAVTARLSTALRDQRIVAAVQDNEARLAALLPTRSTEPEGGGVVAARGPGEGGEEGGVGGSGGVIWDLAQLVPDFVQHCFPRIETFGATVTRGFGFCMDRDCTLRLVRILRLGGAPLLTKGVLSAITTGSLSAVLVAAILAAGGVAFLIVALCALVFSGWLEVVVSAQGACIHFPWWALFGPIPFGR
jgi:hypothetical protein